MKKFAKISLAAAVAVAGLSSVASAKPLEEAIKGVDATGYVTYQYNDRDEKVTASNVNTQSNIYKAGITLSVPASDDLAVKVTGVVRGSTQTFDTNVDTQLAHANFVYTGVKNLTVIAGKQALNTPWTQGSSNIDNTQTGTGALALYNAGFATLAAGHFTNNNIIRSGAVPTNATHSDAAVTISDNDITVAAAIVPMGEVATAQVWYAKIGKTAHANSDINEGASAVNMSVDANLMDVAKLNVTHSTLKGKAADSLDKKQKLTKATLSGSIAMVNLAAAYAKTGKDGGTVSFDADGSAGFKGYRIDANGTQDTTAWLLNANVNVTDSVNLALTHIEADIDNTSVATDDVKAEETYAQVTYKHTKNLSAYVRFGTYETKNASGVKTDDETNGRLQIAYSF